MAFLRLILRADLRVGLTLGSPLRAAPKVRQAWNLYIRVRKAHNEKQ